MKIRAATPKDWPQLRQLFLTVRRLTFQNRDENPFQLSDFDQQTAGEVILLAENVRHEIMGFISIQTENHFIHHLFIQPQQQRQGCGQALLHALPNWGKQAYTLKCIRNNDNAVRFYQACGFNIIGNGVDEYGEHLIFEHSGKDI